MGSPHRQKVQITIGRRAGTESGILRLCDQRMGMGVEFIYREFSSVHELAAWVLAPSLITVRLQPQMEKYRCLWCKSSPNHYM
jgi:hypothetical protein